MQLNNNINDIVAYLQALVPTNQPALDVYAYETSNPASYPYIAVVPDIATISYPNGNKTLCKAVHNITAQIRVYDDRNSRLNSPEATEERMRILYDDLVSYLQTPNIPTSICDFRMTSVGWTYEELASDESRVFVITVSWTDNQNII